MVSSSSLREQKRIDLWKKLHVLKTVTKSNSVKTNSILKDAAAYIKNLELQIEAIAKEYEEMLSQLPDVKVEKIGESRFLVKVTCKKSEHVLVSILEAFEKKDLLVLHAKFDCKDLFYMEAILEDERQVLGVMEVIDAIVMAIDN